MEKKQLTLVVVSLLVVVLSVSVAYFTAQIIGDGKTIDVASANLQIIFSDTDGAISSTDIEPGWTSTKTFTVKNSTKSEYKYNIVLKDLVNTFVTTGYLQYKITSTNSGYNMTEFKDVPKSSTATDTVLAYSVSIPMNVSQEYTITFQYLNDEDIDQSDDMGMELSGTLFITEGTQGPAKEIQYDDGTLGKKLLEDKSTRPGARTDFSTTFTTENTKTLYTSTEDNTTVYYFAGNTSDNWVKFGKTNKGACSSDGNEVKFYINGKLFSPNIDECNYSAETFSSLASTRPIYCPGVDYGYKYDILTDDASYCDNITYGEVSYFDNNEYVKWNSNLTSIDYRDLYWRIIRTNADGSIRLLYHGTSPEATDSYIGESVFNSNSDDSMYVGYMYGTSGSLVNNRANTNNSTAKTTVDNWYASNLVNYTKYLSETAVYCNDREMGSGNYISTGSGEFFFSARERLETNKTPTYDCKNIKDAFSVSNSEAKLTYPIALMTADEIVFAGGSHNIKPESPIWYYRNSLNGYSIYIYNTPSGFYWYTMTPSHYSSSSSKIYGVVITINNGLLSSVYVNEDSNNSFLIRPVTSLKSCVKWASGDGTADNPYTIAETDSGC